MSTVTSKELAYLDDPRLSAMSSVQRIRIVTDNSLAVSTDSSSTFSGIVPSSTV